ncbi:MAG TPA: EamA family transporter [Actinomycetota bacterium]|nr:EamA family transporter [Actinomycetota bacterium]
MVEVPGAEALEGTVHAAANTSGGRLASVVLLLVSVVFAVAGQITLKTAMDNVGRLGKSELGSIGQTVGRVAREPRLWVGLVLFGVSAVFWLIVLSRVRLSVAYPMIGISYIAVVLFARYHLHEHVPPLRWIGVAVIAIGIAVIGFSFRSSSGV